MSPQGAKFAKEGFELIIYYLKEVRKRGFLALRSLRLGVSTYSAGKAAQENRLPAAGKACIIWEKMRNFERETRNSKHKFVSFGNASTLFKK
jgi:hypothetical protein